MATTGGKPRARDLGIPFTGNPGSHNSITDVPGVEVGYTTVVHDDGATAARTGVTAVLPRGRQGVGNPCLAGLHSLNGNGELTGAHWIEETGLLSLPIGITNSHAVGIVHRGIIDWVVQHHPKVAEDWLLPVVGETYDGDLNDINGPHVRAEHVDHALGAASDGVIEEGSVGGGTGMVCYEFKGGSGTASRVVSYGDKAFTVGAFVQANFGTREELTIAGVPVGRSLLDDKPGPQSRPAGSGSVIVIVATDAPLLAGQCKALARRVSLGLARTGTAGSHFSGDIFLAFSTGNEASLHSGYSNRPSEGTIASLSYVPWPLVDPIYTATVEAVEESVVNVLCAGDTMVGRNGYRVVQLPIPKTLDLIRQAGRI